MRGAVNPRRVVLTAATASVAVLAGMLPGTPSAASGSGTAVEIAYTCAFGTGSGTDGGATVTQDATVTVQQTYPASAVAGRSFRPGALTVEVVLDKKAADAVLPAGTTSATATASLTARVTQGPSSADAPWPGLRAAAAPATDGLDLTFTGDATAVTATAPGTVRFDAGRLDLAIAALADPTAPPSGSATDSPPQDSGSGTTADAAGSAAAGADTTVTPAAGTTTGGVTAACTPKDGQATLLGEVVVSGAAGPGRSATRTPPGAGSAAQNPSTGTAASAGAGESPAATSRKGTLEVAAPPHSGVSDCPPPPAGEPDQAILDAVPRPEGANPIVLPPDQRQAECTFLTGLSNVGKLKGAATVNDLDDHPAMTNVTQVGTWFGFQPDGSIYLELDSIVTLDLPPAKSTFLTFGFMPTTAMMTMTQLAPLTLVIAGSSGDDYITYTDVYGKLDLRLSDIKVNGTPLDVGANCHTVRPLDLHLVGTDYTYKGHDGVTRPSDYNEIVGGPLHQDQLTIPPFTGCTAHGDDVDALLTASISGPDNSLNFMQGPLCIPSAFLNCEPEIQYPTPPHR
ncbi:DUF6801 domain-containing protein [Streptomyces sp. NPDC021224]|uniref:DUF6801 domain-containing protein n=1 Tax=unclassified Streptomyces TaxID=2593676 RepID=UPI0037984F34